MTPIIIAHRGYSEVAPENTLPAIQKAVEAGARVIECDIQSTRDGVPVLIHDSTLQRTTSGSGYVWQATCEEVQALDAGAWMHPAFSGVRVPRLADALAVIPREVTLNLEIKPAAFQKNRGIVVSVLELLEGNPHVNAMLSSFSMEVLEEAAGLRESVERVLLMHRPRRLPSIVESLERIGSRKFFCNVMLLNANLADRLRERGIRTGVFSVNSSRSLRQALKCGVDYIITNRVRWCRDAIAGLAD